MHHPFLGLVALGALAVGGYLLYSHYSSPTIGAADYQREQERTYYTSVAEADFINSDIRLANLKPTNYLPTAAGYSELIQDLTSLHLIDTPQASLLISENQHRDATFRLLPTVSMQVGRDAQYHEVLRVQSLQMTKQMAEQGN